MKQFTYVIEHMEPEITGWPELEYKNMLKHVKLHLSHLDPNLKNNMPESLKGAQVSTDSVSEWPKEVQQRVLLLDPASPHELSPEDAENYDYLLFGGILGDDPPQDRTKHLGPKQMTTDTAVLVSQRVLEHGIKLSDLEFVDFPEIPLGKKQTVELPFRYLVENGKPKLPDGLLDLLRKQNDEPLF
ncbi:hypothetical protein HK103_001578 [Boothiomyces macroporosus]|uniref:DUF431-domain-containing protein n=1 Tax=Boothiomyces macroporosus TaxID=261099 RepID=A0AAD5Y4U9_9FUNG|nr:hypothetical protein HK103_001578 [Boothiomyces macroporosus]